MLASITTTGLGWVTPKGDPVFSDLDLSFSQERIGIVGRNGVGKSSLLRIIGGELAATSGSVAVNGTIAALRQIVQVRAGETIADLLGVAPMLDALRRADLGELDVDMLTDIDWSLEPRLSAALARVGLKTPPETPLAMLSGGQRTRVSLVGALLAEPDFLLLDEPTNNLDADGRQAVLDLLASWKSGTIVVSHDRRLLEEMDAILEMTSLGTRRYGGGWSSYSERKAIELAAARHDLDVAERQVIQIDRRVQAALERKQRRDADGARKGARGDMPKLLAGRRKEGAENSGGDGARLAERNRSDSAQRADAARARVEIIEPLAITVMSTGLAANAAVIELSGVSAGYPDAEPILRNMSLEIRGPERIAVTGPNGSGKTTLLRLIAGDLAPASGKISRGLPAAVLDQTVSILDPRSSIIDNYRSRNPRDDEYTSRSALARFGFRADAATKIVGLLSGGQMLRAGLACILGGSAPAPFVILDEPTNHLDLDTIAALETALIAYDGALLVVSHDERFLDALALTRNISVSP